MAAPVRVNDLFFRDLPVLHIVDFKLLRMSEMLKYFSVFKCYCDPHCMFPFLCYIRTALRSRSRFPRILSFRERTCAPPAFFPAEMNSGTVAQAVTASRYLHGPAVHDAVRDLLTCRFIDLRHRCPGNIHLLRALFVGQLLQIDQPDHFIFFHRQRHTPPAGDAVRRKT